MILFFGNPDQKIFAVRSEGQTGDEDVQKLEWLFDVGRIPEESIEGYFIGPRASMISPWSSNAVDIVTNMGIPGILRIEQFIASQPEIPFDPMLFQNYMGLNQAVFDIDLEPAPIHFVEDIQAYNRQEGLALSEDEITYLSNLSSRLGRLLTDSEVFGFSQVNSEHCRHKIFNGSFIIDGKEQSESLFALIKKTSKINPNGIVSAYKDNVAFIKGPRLVQFAPGITGEASFYLEREIDSVLSLKAETHNFPTTVEPFNGAATGSGGEIRDRMAGGRGSIPLAGTAVYMTAYPRVANQQWEKRVRPRKWLYQSPLDILIKASNGASDFGNKFGQPLISGSLLTFEHEGQDQKLAYDKVIMLAGGIGYANAAQAQKARPAHGDRIVVLGGDNYRIGMGGAAVSSADTGEYGAGIELNAVQRSNPEMQKRVANAIRTMVEDQDNPIVSIHDHGAGGHLNCLSELVEETGGKVNLDLLPIGDPTLSAKEIIGNESQERMGLVISAQDLGRLQATAKRERAPLYEVGMITGDDRFSFYSEKTGEKPIDLKIDDLIGNSPKTIIYDQTHKHHFEALTYSTDEIYNYTEKVLQMEAVGCKDWLTNKVDRCVGGLVAKQQCVGPLQLPLNNVGAMALDFSSPDAIATSIGHAPISGLIDSGAGARNAVTEALTNLIWAPLKDGIKSVSLSANWMWPCKNPGEDARLYEAVKAISDFCISLGINIPTGKDSLSMKQKYADEEVISPGTVIVSAVGHCQNKSNIIEPLLDPEGGPIYYINFSQDNYHLGGSSFAQTLNRVGEECPDVKNPDFIIHAFNAIQQLIKQNKIVAGHDISSGGMITSLLEMCFAQNNLSAEIDLSQIDFGDPVRLFFSENSGIIFQGRDRSVEDFLEKENVAYKKIGHVIPGETLFVLASGQQYEFDIPKLRDFWYRPSFLFDKHQTRGDLATHRFNNYKIQPLQFVFPPDFTGKKPVQPEIKKIRAGVLREQGSNSEREMANALYLAGFEVKDIHMTDLISGREDLSDIQFLGVVGGFSNSDVLGSAKGWAGSFLFNKKAKSALERFFERNDVLSLGICNGCQLFIELNVINPSHSQKSKMLHNDSGKHESAFTSVFIQNNKSVMLSSLEKARLGVWISHGEGKFHLPLPQDRYNIVAEYGYDQYPANPNGSDYNAAMICSDDGRHLITMPHIERSIFPWNWAHYPGDRNDKVSPWISAFINAREWLENKSE